MFKHILLPTDGSELALRAVDIGLALASRLGASAHALHVVAPFPAVTYFAEMIQMPSEAEYVEDAKAAAERYLADVRERARTAGVSCESSYEFDRRPYAAIVGAAARHQCDLIVMGSHGRSGLDRLVLGSETYKAMLSTQIPVLVCH